MSDLIDQIKRQVALPDTRTQNAVKALIDVAEAAEGIRYALEDHASDETELDTDEPYCFECEVPWPCQYGELRAALDRLREVTG